MLRPVLLGGRAYRRRNDVLQGFLVWLPVVIAVAVVMRESTPQFSSQYTNHPLRQLWESIFGPVSEAHWDVVHFYVRKSGHFFGYGLVGLTWLRACLLTFLPLLWRRSAALWRSYSATLAICGTMLIAATDELHQTYLPNRTGLITDALLDTCGALAMMLLVSLTWLWRSKRKPLA